MGRKIGILVSFGMMLLEIVSALFLTPLLIRNFGQSEYGVYTLIISIASYLTLLDLGIGNSVVKYVSKHKANNQIAELNSFEGIITTFYVVIAIVTLAIGAILVTVFPNVFAKGFSADEIDLAQKLLSITVLNVAITLGTAGFYYTVIGDNNFLASKGVSLAATLLRITVSFIALMNGSTSLTIVIINTATNVGSRLIIVLYVLLKMKIRPSLKGVSKAQIKEVVFFSAFIFLQMLATQINSMTDNVLIGIVATDASALLAVYGIGATLKQYVGTLGGAVNGVLMPSVVKQVESNASSREIQEEMTRVGRIVFMLIGFAFCGFIICGREFIQIWAGAGYEDSYPVAIILMSAYVVSLTQSIGTQYLWAMNKHKVQSIIQLAIVLINIVFTLLFMRWNILLGAAVGTFVSYLFGDVILMQILLKKVLGIKLGEYYRGLLKGLLPSMLISMAAGFAVGLFDLGVTVSLLVKCVAMIVTFGICLLTFGFSKYERNLMRSIIKRPGGDRQKD